MWCRSFVMFNEMDWRRHWSLFLSFLLCCVVKTYLLKGNMQYLVGSNQLQLVCVWCNERCFESHWFLRRSYCYIASYFCWGEGGKNWTRGSGFEWNWKKSFFFYTSVIWKTHNPDWDVVKSMKSLFECVVKVMENSVPLDQ